MAQIRKELEDDPPKWHHSRILEDIEVAIAVGHASDFWDLPEQTQSYLIARFRVRGTREAYEERIAKEERKRNTKSRAPGRR